MPPFSDGTYLAFIDAWQREINYLSDRLIRETALNEADTTTRLQTVWQVKLLPVANTNGDCHFPYPEWEAKIKPPTGEMRARTYREDKDENPCDLPPEGGYQRLENQLYRIEIHKGGNLSEMTFKWSRENASVETKIIRNKDKNNKFIYGNKFLVEDLGKDEILGFADGQWVEIIDDENSLNGTPQPLLQIINIDRARKEIEVHTDDIPNKNNTNLRLRRWDQKGDNNGIPSKAGWIDIEAGIQVEFTNESYRAGDYWLVPARASIKDVEWPPYNIPNKDPLFQPHKGVWHHYCPLAIVMVSGGIVSVKEDCRPVFPSLTEICAEDICYKSNNCHLTTAGNVQDALDDICRRQENSCTLFVGPGLGWEKVFEKIKENQDAQICFQAGRYILSQAAKIKGKGHLKLTGCGSGTRIISPKSESALVFEQCASVVVRDIYAETGHTIYHHPTTKVHLNGVLTFLRCPAVQVQNVQLKCGAGAVRTNTCITVRNEHNHPASVNIQHSNLRVGHRQQGILIVNAGRATVENNTLTVYSKPTHLATSQAVKSRNFRAELKGLLISQAVLGASKDATGLVNTKVTHGGYSVSFRTHTSLKTSRAWTKLMQTHPPGEIDSDRALLNYLLKTTDRIVLDKAFREELLAFKEYFDKLAQRDAAVMTQGITVAGKVAADIRILNNSIAGTLQGVHIGLSHQQLVNSPSYHADFVTISGNLIAIRLPATISRLERYGVFVGNCRSLIIENNNITLNRLKEAENTEIEGIRVWGLLGQRMLIAKNYLSSLNGEAKLSFHTGIHVNPLTQRPANAQWLITQNVLLSKRNPIWMRNGVVADANTP